MEYSNKDYLNYSFDTFIESALKLKHTVIDFYAATPHLVIDHYSYQEAYAVRELLDQSHLQVLDYCPHNYGYSFFYETGSTFYNISKDYYINSIHSAKILGAKTISFHAPIKFLQIDSKELSNRQSAMLDSLKAVAAEESIRFIYLEEV